MSAYERYAVTAASYDDTRWAAGQEVILGCLAQADGSLASMTLLDAGCGTGNYARALIDRVGRIEALDLEPAMLERAKAKLRGEEAAGRIRFHRGSVTELPFADAAVDGVMVNQMLHHLPGEPGDPLAGYRRAFAEFARVLRPGGVLVVNSCAPHQLDRGYWYYALIPEAARRIRERFPPLVTLRGMLEEEGMEWRGSFAPLDLVLMGEAYFDPRGPLDPVWRAGDSTFALVTPEELERALATLRRLEAEGRLERFLAEQDAEREKVGQITVFYARKPAGG